MSRSRAGCFHGCRAELPAGDGWIKNQPSLVKNFSPLFSLQPCAWFSSHQSPFVFPWHLCPQGWKRCCVCLGAVGVSVPAPAPSAAQPRCDSPPATMHCSAAYGSVCSSRQGTCCSWLAVGGFAVSRCDSPRQRLQTSGNVSLRSLSEEAFSILAYLRCYLRATVRGPPQLRHQPGSGSTSSFRWGRFVNKSFNVTCTPQPPSVLQTT